MSGNMGKISPKFLTFPDISRECPRLGISREKPNADDHDLPQKSRPRGDASLQWKFLEVT